jgi:signal transduction histidine kinase
MVLSWLGTAALRRAQARTALTYRVAAIQHDLASQGEGLESLGQVLAASWASSSRPAEEPGRILQAALPLLRQQDLVSNLTLCAADGGFVTLVRTTRGWDLIEGGPAFGPKRARLTKQVDAPAPGVDWIRLPDGYPETRPWFKEGMVRLQPGWMSPPYPFVGTPAGGLSYLLPVLGRDRQRLGLVCIDCTQTRISRVMASILDNPFSRTMVSDPSHQVLVPPQPPSVPDPGEAFQILPVETVPWAGPLLDRPTGGRKPAMAIADIGGLPFLTCRAPLDLGSAFHGDLWVAYPMVPGGPLLRYGGLVLTLVLSLLLLGWLFYLRGMSRCYGQPMQRLLRSAETANRGGEVPDFDSDIWELRQVGQSLQLAGRAVRERQGLEDQLLQTQRFEIMSALAGGVIHDVNNVLSIVMLRLSRALDREDSSPAAEDVRAGLAAARQGAALNRQLLSLGRKDEEPLHHHDLNDCLRDAGLLVRPALGHDIVLELELEPAEAPLPVRVRAVEITQALLNLALNARDAMPEGGLLLMRTCRHGSEAWLEVEDGGDGIPEAHQDRIFEPYFTTKPEGKGSGLGLAIVKRVVERHQGRIELFRAPGRGQGFRLVFPLAD